MRILTLNCGSSTLKFDVFEADGNAGEPVRIASGSVDRIGGKGTAALSIAEEKRERSAETAGHRDAFEAATALLSEAGLLDGIDAAGHRVVHGGPRFRSSALIDSHVIAAIREVSELAPLHNRPALDVIEAARDAFGDETAMVAAFDTAFFADLPDVAALYALPRELSDRFGIRRFGFHGLAHGYMVRRFRELHPGLSRPRLVTLQLGSGSSATASLDGRPIDTSMGYTPLEGLIMGTRTGDLDPALPLRLQELTGLPAGDVEDMLNVRSGLLGLSRRSADMRDLLAAAAAGDRDCALAIDSFCARVKKYVGAYMALLGGADGIVFGGGIGENLPEVRARVCEDMGWAGLRLDGQSNAGASGRETRISSGDSSIEAWVIRVDEAAVIAAETEQVLGKGGGENHAADS